MRVSFTTKTDIETTTGTLETANATVEQSQYLRYTNAKRVNASIFDHTNGASAGYSERLNGSANEKYGLARSLSVMPGDSIKLEVYAKYVDPNSGNWTGALSTLVAQIAANTAGVVVDGTAYSNSTSSFPLGYGTAVSKDDNGAPKAYLNWLIFDRNFGFITGGFKQITTAGKEAGSDVAHEKVEPSSPIVITQPGYVYVYLSNEEASYTREVYFDDFKVTHTKSPVIETSDYYPFGLRYNNYTRENALANKLKLFQGQEHVEDLGLNWDSFKWRNHQPDIGRFFNLDKLSEKYYYNSPYAFSENKVVAHRELEGLESNPINGEIKKIENVVMPVVKEVQKTVESVIEKGKEVLSKLELKVEGKATVTAGLQFAAQYKSLIGANLNLGSVDLFKVSGSITLNKDGLDVKWPKFESVGNEKQLRQEASLTLDGVNGSVKNEASYNNGSFSNVTTSASGSVGGYGGEAGYNWSTGDASGKVMAQQQLQVAAGIGFDGVVGASLGTRQK